ncbi:MAG: NAD(P)H-hydrate dehydratase [Oscillospiraceae bacterium]
MQQQLSLQWVRSQLPTRAKQSHKGTYGTLSVVGGCRNYRGAAILAVEGALRAGTGIVRLCATEPVCAAAAARLSCCTFLTLNQSADGGIDAASADDILNASCKTMLIGPGLGNTEESFYLVLRLVQGATVPLVLDADALNVLAGSLAEGASETHRVTGLAAISNAAHTPVLTPHIAELARLCGLTNQQVLKDQQGAAASLAAQLKAVVVAKSDITIVASPSGNIYINDTAGNPGMAKGGSGDVLAGIIAALMAQGISAEISAACGVWLHASAGDEAAALYGQAGMSPADLPACLTAVWQRLGL